MADALSLALLENLQKVDAGGCPAPFIGEALHPFRGGCEFATTSNRLRENTDNDSA
jgi:hypothetical protein